MLVTMTRLVNPPSHRLSIAALSIILHNDGCDALFWRATAVRYVYPSRFAPNRLGRPFFERR